MKATTRVEARVEAAPPVIVPLQGAPVVEFFGIPLEDAQDVVFVLDRSGSMAELAQGRMAQIDIPANPPPVDTTQSGPLPVAAAATPPPPVQPPPANEPAPFDPGASANEPVADAPVHRQPRKIDVAHAELVAALERLPAGTRMNVVFFNEELEAFAPHIVPLEESARAGLVGFVWETVPIGSTALAPAMRTAFLMNARRIVLLSDGLGNVGGNVHSLLRDAREAIRGGVRIDTIGIGPDQDARLLETLARESRGLYQAL